MAKTRAQRKAEKRAREERQVKQGRPTDSEAARDTQLPRSAVVQEAEAVIESGLSEEELKAPAPSRADLPPAEPEPAELEKKSRAERRREKDAVAEPKAKKAPPTPAKRPAAPAPERQRNAVVAFFISCWAELKRVQWPDRSIVGQATAVVLVFVALAAAYLGALDAAFNWLVKRIL